MKGIIFTEFLEMVEGQFGIEVSDAILTETASESGGIYTAIGTYNHAEMFDLVEALHKRTGLEVSELLRTYARYFFKSVVHLYPNFFEHVPTAFVFLESVESHIHKEVLKLYPDAELPSFVTERNGEHELIMYYSSVRKMSDFAHGLILSTLEHFEQQGTIERHLIDDEGCKVKFIINIA
jgi:hypothetical protein